MSHRPISRRKFLAGAAAAIGAPFVVPASVLGRAGRLREEQARQIEPLGGKQCGQPAI